LEGGQVWGRSLLHINRGGGFCIAIIEKSMNQINELSQESKPNFAPFISAIAGKSTKQSFFGNW